MVIADTIVMAATWMSLRHQVKESLELKVKSRVSAIMLADGTRTCVEANMVETNLGSNRESILCVRNPLLVYLSTTKDTFRVYLILHISALAEVLHVSALLCTHSSEGLY